MEILQGRSLRPGVAIASAARVAEEYGSFTLDPRRLRQLGERLRLAVVDGVEPDQVVLIGSRIGVGFVSAPLPGLEYVGIAAERVTGDRDALQCPAVEELPNTLLNLVEENDIVIIDGDRGRVYIAPDAMTLARYQAPIRRARRVFLGGEHLPARTISDNRLVSVIAYAPTLADASAAIEGGADGLWLPDSNDFLGPADAYQSSAEQEGVFAALSRIAAGKPIFIHIPPERLSLTALARSASDLPVHIVLDDAAQRDDIGERLAGIEEDLEANDILYGTVRFEAGFNTETDDALPEALDRYTGVCVTEDLGRARMERLIVAAGQTHQARKPLTLVLPAHQWQTALHEALDLIAGRVVAAVGAISEIKDAIRVS